MSRHPHHGALAAGLGFVCWGFFPLYFALVPEARPLEVLANRIVWSLVLVVAGLALWRRWAWLGAALRRPRLIGAYVVSSLLLSANWLTFIYAATHGHVVDASLGYFITPLVNVALGTIVLGERPRRAQWLAVAIAAIGVVVLTVGSGTLPWIGLVLAFSFGFYGLLRKVAPLGAVEGFALETMILFPASAIVLGWWWGSGPASFPAPTAFANAWLIGLGPATAIPLLLFSYGARLIPMTTLGLLQYLSPTIAFILGVAVFGETLTVTRLVGFAFIWAALALYTIDGWRTVRRAVPATPIAA